MASFNAAFATSSSAVRVMRCSFTAAQSTFTLRTEHAPGGGNHGAVDYGRYPT